MTEVLPEVETYDQREDLQAMIDNLELLSLALALKVPVAVAGHVARSRLGAPRKPQANTAGALSVELRRP